MVLGTETPLPNNSKKVLTLSSQLAMAFALLKSLKPAFSNKIDT